MSRRTEVLHEMYYHSKGESLFPEDVVALRQGRWKLIEAKGGLRDAHWYRESISADALNSSDTTWTTTLAEHVLRWLERSP